MQIPKVEFSEIRARQSGLEIVHGCGCIHARLTWQTSSYTVPHSYLYRAVIIWQFLPSASKARPHTYTPNHLLITAHA